MANEMHIGNYQVAEAFLAEVPKFTRKNPLEQSKAFYQYIQQNHSAAFAEKNLGRIVHVAGTNGKGSVCAFIQQICLESGLQMRKYETDIKKKILKNKNTHVEIIRRYVKI